MKSPSQYQRQEYAQHPFLAPAKDVYHQLGTNKDTGLSILKSQEAQRKYGPNKLDGEGGVQWYSVLLKQVSNAMILVLVLAMALSYGVTDYIEGGVITAVIILNITIGFYQDFQAEKKMDSLRSLSSPSASVLRDGHTETIPSAEVVPGDIVRVNAGDTIPADLRLIDSMNLECDEKILTGEAIPVLKDAKAAFKDGDEVSIGVVDRINMAYSSSTVTKGRGTGIVVYTGMFTEIGKIAESMQGKQRKANRSLSTKQGALQPPKGAVLRVWDTLGAFLGLTTGTPLQRKLSKLAYLLFLGALILAVAVFGVNGFEVTNEVAIYAISTGIAIIPESLIAVLTITMVVGMTQMRKRKVVLRQLSALEALGGVTNICSDKTGTLTQGQMIARKVWLPGSGVYVVEGAEQASNPTNGTVTFGLSGSGTPEISDEGSETTEVGEEKAGDGEKSEETITTKAAAPAVTRHLGNFLQSIALCNLASVRFDEQRKEWQAIGDPTEIALQVFALRFDYGKRRLEEKEGWKQLAEYPFDSSIKRMSVVYQPPGDGRAYLFTKGAVERIVERCSKIGIGGSIESFAAEKQDEVLSQMTTLADQGLRVLAIAQRTLDSYQPSSNILRGDIEADLTLIGLVGLYDPPRLETKGAVQECHTAGIKVHMLTGDHPSTATSIAKEVGILPPNTHSLSSRNTASMVQTAAQFDLLTDAALDALPSLPLVVARCAPSTKTRMLHALHRRRCFAAMTGDGVNDAPSLQAADVGIAMGLAGSDVAKGAASIVLTDDNFASIVNAVEEGRRMFDNIQKFVLHLLTSNVAEVILLIGGLAFQDEAGQSVFPLSPLAILWINMLTSSFPAFGLGREKASADIMRRPPHDSRRGVFTQQITVDLFVYGTLMGSLALLTFVIIVYGAGKGELGIDCNKHVSGGCEVVFRARAAVFAELTWLILISAWEFKSLRSSLFALPPTPPPLPPTSSQPQHQQRSSLSFPPSIYSSNRFLFLSVVLGALSVFPAVYIPGLNKSVFKHAGIGWEWALAGGAVGVFVAGVEVWKGWKRGRGWFEERGCGGGESGGERVSFGESEDEGENWGGFEAAGVEREDYPGAPKEKALQMHTCALLALSFIQEIFYKVEIDGTAKLDTSTLT